MKKINLTNLSEKNGYMIDNFMKGVIDMQFIKYGDKYLIEGSNGYVVDEKEKLQIEKGELVLKDITGCNCQKDTTLKIKEIDKQLEELEQEEKPKKSKKK